MRSNQIIAAALVLGGFLVLPFEQAQNPGIVRTELTRRDLADPVREVIQTRVDFAVGATFPKHSHPGVEVAYVLRGLLEYQLDGKPPVTLKAGTSLFIGAGAIHLVRNVGSGNASELATYVVAKGLPLVLAVPGKS